MSRGHVHEAAYDESTGLDAHGSLVITEFCECGQPLRTYVDSVA